MKLETIKRRLSPGRPMTSVTLRMPQDVVDDLKRIAPLRGFTGYQALMRAYVGAGLREDLERYDNDAVAKLLENLKRQGVSNEILERAVNQCGMTPAP